MQRTTVSIVTALTVGCAAILQAQPTGQWDFDNGDLSATVGQQPMTYANPTVTAAGTVFGTTTALGLPDIDGTPASVMGFQEFALGEGYYMPTPGPNGGGSLVNIWTLIMDVLYPASSDGQWRAFIDIDEGVIAADAEFFVNPANGIGISGNYTGEILPDTWYRVAVTMDSTTGEMRKYINGLEVGVQNLGDTFEGRWAMSANYRAELFADNDGDVAPGYVNSIQLRDTLLTPGEIFALGGPSAEGIPQTIPATSSFIESRAPAADAVGVSPSPQVQIVLNTGNSTVAQSSIKLSLDDTEVTPTVTSAGRLYTVSYTVPEVLQPVSVHALKLDWTDSVDGARSETWSFTVADFALVNLPDPIHLETFDAVGEGELPVGWVVTNLTDQLTPGFDLGNASSDAYMDFVIISVETLAALNVDSDRRFALNPIVLNGEVLSSLVSGNFAYGESDVRGGNQVQVMFSPDYDLTGQDNVFVSWNSMYEQNQDNIAAVEYSIDGGTTWLPVLYMVDEADVIMSGDEVDAVATLTTARGDQAYGEAYGVWIGAQITQDLAPHISGRVNDDRWESKRVELYRLEAADNQPSVRFRFVHAGTASWYFGIDNVGLYSIDAPIPPAISDQPVSQWVHAGASFTLSVAATGTEPFTYQWQLNGSDIPGAVEASYSVAAARAADGGDYQVVVSNAGGSDTSDVTSVSVFAGAITEGLVAHLKFDNNLNDASSGGNNGTAVGSPTFVTGLIGTHAVNIPSGADYVSLGTPSDLNFGSTTDFSISFWAQSPAGGWSSDPSFIGNKDWNSGSNQGYVIATDGDGRVQWNLAGPPGNRKDFDGPGGVIGNDAWHHVAVTFDRTGTASTYVEGVLINRTDLTGSENNVNTPGSYATNVGQDGTGSYGAVFNNLSVDDLGIWRRVLTPQEVAAIREAGLQGQDLSTVIIETVGPEITAISIDQGNVTLTWGAEPQTRLQKATDLTGAAWSDVDGTLGQGSHSEAVGAGNAFFRLSKGQ